ncbi:Arc family DNA-binding protein [Comamonas aquatica]|uniref:Arc family DNA-binding protein n=1 Tax=Comamonas aquatica TaxID=225991 RepID=UPI00320B00A6
MPEERKPQAEDKYIIRFPDGMRDRLKDAAKANNRTLNAEIVARLERSFTADKEVEQIAFESGFETSMLREDVARLTALLQKANESKANQSQNTDEIADKVATRLLKMIPIPLENLDRLTPDYAKPGFKRANPSKSE